MQAPDYRQARQDARPLQDTTPKYRRLWAPEARGGAGNKGTRELGNKRSTERATKGAGGSYKMLSCRCFAEPEGSRLPAEGCSWSLFPCSLVPCLQIGLGDVLCASVTLSGLSLNDLPFIYANFWNRDPTLRIASPPPSSQVISASPFE